MKKIINIVTLLLMIIFIPAVADAEEIFDNSVKIDSLLEERARMICQERYNEIDYIDQQLKELNVEKLTQQEVDERFGNNQNLPYAVVPSSKNITWFSNRTNYAYGSKIYEIQTLIAQPNENDSGLKKSGSRVISSTYRWEAGFMNALSTLALDTAGRVVGNSLALTVYNTASSFLSNLKTTTEISSAKIIYSYSHTTTASFKYIKEKGQSDSNQFLAYISTSGVTSVGYQYPTFDYAGGTVTPNVIQGSRVINSIPDGYNSNSVAVNAYVSGNNTAYNFLTSVKITGLESKNVSNILPVCPMAPGLLS
ncbi:MAG: DUF507 family protein [Lachnospiraceae bacterium]|nr:DUF507 family protein [Lachnospiraceae bacterium]